MYKSLRAGLVLIGRIRILRLLLKCGKGMIRSFGYERINMITSVGTIPLERSPNYPTVNQMVVRLLAHLRGARFTIKISMISPGIIIICDVERMIPETIIPGLVITSRY